MMYESSEQALDSLDAFFSTRSMLINSVGNKEESRKWGKIVREHIQLAIKTGVSIKDIRNLRIKNLGTLV